MLIKYFKSKKKLYVDALNKGRDEGKRKERKAANLRLKRYKKEVDACLSKKNKKITALRKRANEIEYLVKWLGGRLLRAEDALIRTEDTNLLTYRKVVSNNQEVYRENQRLTNEALVSIEIVRKKLPELEFAVEKFKIKDAEE